MGNRLSPDTAKSTTSGVSSCGTLAYAAASMQGRRSSMEDAHVAVPDLWLAHHGDGDDHLWAGHALFGVFDGHGGAAAAKFAAQHLSRVLLSHPALDQYKQLILQQQQQQPPQEEDQDKRSATTTTNNNNANKAAALQQSSKRALLTQILEETFVEMDKQFLLARQRAMESKRLERAQSSVVSTTTGGQKANGINTKAPNFKDPGTTALVVLVTPDLIVCANAGDCRALLIQDGPPPPPLQRAATVPLTQSTTPPLSASSSFHNYKSPKKSAQPRMGADTTAWKPSSPSPSSPSPRKAQSPPVRPCSSFVALSTDHRPDVAEEEARIRKAGGYVFGGRLQDDLAVSRGWGDYRFKDVAVILGSETPSTTTTPTTTKGKTTTTADQKVSPHPEIRFVARKAGRDKLLLLACDGVFECLSNDKVCRTVSQSLLEHDGSTTTKAASEHTTVLMDSSGRSGHGTTGATSGAVDTTTMDLEGACHQLLDKSLRKGSKDNMTALVVQLHRTVATNGGGEDSANPQASS